MHRFLTLFRRALVRRCPRCSGRDIFEGWFTMVEDCPTCGHHYEREDGFWLGSMIINFAVTMGAFLVVFVGGILFTWPTPNYTVLLIVSLMVAGLSPMIAFPWTRTIFVALEMTFHPLEPHEIEAAEARRSGGSTG